MARSVPTSTDIGAAATLAVVTPLVTAVCAQAVAVSRPAAQMEALSACRTGVFMIASLEL
ncbi:hypothetical protein FQZ97_783220 [compost metagenome]